MDKNTRLFCYRDKKIGLKWTRKLERKLTILTSIDSRFLFERLFKLVRSFSFIQCVTLSSICYLEFCSRNDFLCIFKKKGVFIWGLKITVFLMTTKQEYNVGLFCPIYFKNMLNLKLIIADHYWRNL